VIGKLAERRKQSLQGSIQPLEEVLVYVLSTDVQKPQCQDGRLSDPRNRPDARVVHVESIDALICRLVITPQRCLASWIGLLRSIGLSEGW